MKLRTLPTFIAAAGLAFSANAQLPRIVVQGTGAPQVYTDFEAAVTAAQPNDVLYLSGGVFLYPNDFQIDKPLHLIGAGIHPDSSQVTATTTLQNATGTSSPLRLLTVASGSTFTGIRFTSSNGNNSSDCLRFGLTEANDDPTDLVFQRCWFTGRVYLGASTTLVIPSTTAFDECIFLGMFDGYNRSAAFTRCVIANGYSTITLMGLLGASTLDNCVVLGTIQNNDGITVRNSFLRTSGSYAAYACSNCVFQNNITPSTTVTDASPGVVLSNNLVNVDEATVFMSETNGYYEVTDNLHLQPGCAGVGHGTDGTDVGIYGSSSPYKPGAVPFNPHFRQADIAPSTNNNGALPVNIRVAAQSH